MGPTCMLKEILINKLSIWSIKKSQANFSMFAITELALNSNIHFS